MAAKAATSALLSSTDIRSIVCTGRSCRRISWTSFSQPASKCCLSALTFDGMIYMRYVAGKKALAIRLDIATLSVAPP
jgi:hypothetical protein